MNGSSQQRKEEASLSHKKEKAQRTTENYISNYNKLINEPLILNTSKDESVSHAHGRPRTMLERSKQIVAKVQCQYNSLDQHVASDGRIFCNAGNEMVIENLVQRETSQLMSKTLATVPVRPVALYRQKFGS